MDPGRGKSQQSEQSEGRGEGQIEGRGGERDVVMRMVMGCDNGVGPGGADNDGGGAGDRSGLASVVTVRMQRAVAW